MRKEQNRKKGERGVRNEKRRKKNSLSTSLGRAFWPCCAPALTHMRPTASSPPSFLLSTAPLSFRVPFLLHLLETYRFQRPGNSLCWRPPRPVPSPPYTHICSCDRSCKTVPGKHGHHTIVSTRVESQSMETGLEYCQGQIQSAGIKQSRL